MTRKVAILGLGATGGRWARDCHAAGWRVAVFDPEPDAEGGRPLKGDWKRHDTISGTVKGADWVLIAVPDRLELIRKVIQRVQAEAPERAVILSAARAFGIDEVQGCAWRPEQVVLVGRDETGGIALTLSQKNAPGLREDLTEALSAIAAVAALGDPPAALPARPLRGEASA